MIVFMRCEWNHVVVGILYCLRDDSDEVSWHADIVRMKAIERLAYFIGIGSPDVVIIIYHARSVSGSATTSLLTTPRRDSPTHAGGGWLYDCEPAYPRAVVHHGHDYFYMLCRKTTTTQN